ncbi:MAG TPA: hypothetical protein PKK18_12340 [Chitinophagales bacterium]|nr:hypothetical protein [Chitinophagales bacterium]HMU99337.1 hypothetical protein [Chitinophagales bacterium]HMV03785.1 hypothetical protein [Chitinophagales bacterium]HMX61208.1 hypothetical protein [Chitinophagales bacterium]HMY43741.1 hypothetical protein [Chitinophagales bacterium]
MAQIIDKKNIIGVLPYLQKLGIENTTLNYDKGADVMFFIFLPNEATTDTDWDEEKPDILYHLYKRRNNKKYLNN